MQNFIYFLIELQNKILNKKTSNKSKYLGFGATLCLNSKTKNTKIKLENDIKKILSKHNSVEELINYIESCGVKVYKFKNAKKLMNSISQEYGFIPQTHGLKSILLNFIISVNTNTKFNAEFKTESMFVIDKKECDKFWFIQQIYKWHAMNLNMPGYDAITQENFNSLMINDSDTKIKSLSIDEILNIKDAIERDKESIEFVVELAKSTVDSKAALSKISAGGACV